MKLVEHPITLGGNELLLTTQRAIYWPEERALILSDLHLGKASHFRQHGIALPSSVSERDIERLAQLLEYYQPTQTIIVGDFVHASVNREVASFAELAVRYPDTCFTLIRGNHDRVALDQLAGWGIANCMDSWQLRGVHFVHTPTHGQVPTISGHVHPGVRIRLPHKKHLKLPCYVRTGEQLILPAFSLFTGLDTRSVPSGSVCFAIHEAGIVEITT